MKCCPFRYINTFGCQQPPWCCFSCWLGELEAHQAKCYIMMITAVLWHINGALEVSTSVRYVEHCIHNCHSHSCLPIHSLLMALKTLLPLKQTWSVLLINKTKQSLLGNCLYFSSVVKNSFYFSLRLADKSLPLIAFLP